MKKYLAALLIVLFILTGCVGKQMTEVEKPAETLAANSVIETEKVDTLEPKKSLEVSNEASEKRVLTISADENDYPDIEVVVNKYNISGNEEKYISQLSSALMGGTADDVFILQRDMFTKFGESPYVYDLNKLMENNSTFNKDDYYTNIMEAFGINGKLPVIPDNIDMGFTGIAGEFKNKTTPIFIEFDTVKYSDLIEMYNSLDSKDKSNIYLSSANVTFISAILSNAIDYENKTCEFNNGNFVKLLESSKNISNPQTNAAKPGAYYLPKWGSTLVDNYPYLFGFAYYMKALCFCDDYVLETNYGMNYDVIEDPAGHFADFKPLTDEAGNALLEYNGYFAINAHSPNIDLAWEFIKFTLTEESKGRYNNQHSDYIVLSKERNERLTKENLIYHIKKCVSGNAKLKDSEAEQITLTDQQLDDVNKTAQRYLAYCELPARFWIRKLPTGTEQILNDYISNKITAEQTAEQFQNKVSLILSE